MFDPTSQQQHHPADQQRMQQCEQHDSSERATLADFPFCYTTSNLVHKSQIQQNAKTNENDNSSYKFEVAQTFNCSYAIVNQISLANTTTYKCDICGLVFATVSLLNQHKKIHSNNSISLVDRIFACDVCGATFAQLCDMKAHLQTAHTSNKSSDIHVECDHSSNRKSKLTETEHCESVESCNVAKNNSHSLNPLKRDACTGTDEKSFPATGKRVQSKRKTLATITKCPKCNGTGLVVVGNVQNASEKPYHCNICDSTFSRYSSLWSHRKLHSGEKPFKCDLCGSTFARASSLKNHSRVHTGERPYKCNICGMQFSQAHHLKSHERIHSGERPYECEVCGKSFARHSTLWNHRRIHTGEKPYSCDICGSAFHQATHLKNHAKVHSGEKPYKCDICGVGFSDRFALKRHRAIHDKYGQTSTSQPNASLSSSNSWKHSQNSSNNSDHLETRMYNSDASDLNKQSHETSQVQVIYSDAISFPGCSKPDKL